MANGDATWVAVEALNTWPGGLIKSNVSKMPRLEQRATLEKLWKAARSPGTWQETSLDTGSGHLGLVAVEARLGSPQLSVGILGLANVSSVVIPALFSSRNFASVKTALVLVTGMDAG